MCGGESEASLLKERRCADYLKKGATIMYQQFNIHRTFSSITSRQKHRTRLQHPLSVAPSREELHKGLNTLYVQSAQSRTPSSEIAFLRTVVV